MMLRLNCRPLKTNGIRIKHCVILRGGSTVATVARGIACAALVVALANCGDSASTTTRSGSVAIDEEGYARRRVVAATLTEASCAGATADSVCMIGTIEQAVDAGGAMYVLGDGTLLRLDGDNGAAVVARDGGGPGELRAPIALGSGADGGVAIFDIGRMRLIEFASGEGPSEATVFPPSGFREAKVRAGSLYAYTLPAASALGDTVQAAVLRVSRSDTTWSDTLARFAQPAISVRGADGQALSRLPWDPMVLWDACENGEAIVGRSNAWRISWYRDGVTVGSVQRAVAADAMTDAEHDSLSQDWLERSPKLESFRTSLAQRLAEKPSSRPHLHSVFCASNNRAVVVNAPKFGDNHRVVDVLDRDGRVALSVRVPLHIRLIGVAGDDMLGIDELGRSDVLYRIAIDAAVRN